MADHEQQVAPPDDVTMAEKDTPEQAALALTPVGMEVDQHEGDDRQIAPATMPAAEHQKTATPEAGSSLFTSTMHGTLAS